MDLATDKVHELAKRTRPIRTVQSRLIYSIFSVMAVFNLFIYGVPSPPKFNVAFYILLFASHLTFVV